MEWKDMVKLPILILLVGISIILIVNLFVFTINYQLDDPEFFKKNEHKIK